MQSFGAPQHQMPWMAYCGTECLTSARAACIHGGTRRACAITSIFNCSSARMHPVSFLGRGRCFLTPPTAPGLSPPCLGYFTFKFHTRPRKNTGDVREVPKPCEVTHIWGIFGVAHAYVLKIGMGVTRAAKERYCWALHAH